MVTTPSPVPVPVEPPKPQVEQTWRPTVAGVLNIIAGALGIIGGIVVIALLQSNMMLDLFYPNRVMPPSDRAMMQIVLNLFAVGGIVGIVMGILTLIGGIYITKRKKWGLGLAASIIAIIIFLPLGILSTIFISQSKKEFS